MAEFIQKYRNFKIYDEKGRVYPVHIDKAMFYDCKSGQTQNAKTG